MSNSALGKITNIDEKKERKIYFWAGNFFSEIRAYVP